MNIYIKIEVLKREIEGRMLLALVAAERGHNVFLGDFRALLSHRRWLPPGVYHDKSLTPSRSKILLHQTLAQSGFVVTSQDEEHGLLQREYASHAAARFSSKTLGSAAYAFMWGPHDAGALRTAYPEFASRIVETGSPRVDMWRPASSGFYRDALQSRVDRDRPLVLIVAHGVGCLSVNRFWTELENVRENYIHGSDDPLEWEMHELYAQGARDLGRFVRAVRSAVMCYPHIEFVLRPHPSTAEGAWDSLIGAYPNLAVLREGAVGPWIRRAALVIHDASTVGFEAAVAGVPLASFWPTDERPEFVSAHLGARFTTVEDLGPIIDRALSGQDKWFGQEDAELLEQRFGDLHGPLAAECIVDAWEVGGSQLSDAPPVRPTLRNLAASTHRLGGRLRSTWRDGATSEPFRTAHKFPKFDRSEIRRLIGTFRAGFERFEKIELRFHGARLLSLRTKN